jgi:hypothetical protein
MRVGQAKCRTSFDIAQRRFPPIPPSDWSRTAGGDAQASDQWRFISESK